MRGVKNSWHSQMRRLIVLILWSTLAITLLTDGVSFCANAQSWGDPEWSDEFNSDTPGAPPDARKWTYDVGGDGWGNHELEVYCAPGSPTPAPCDSTHPNAFLDGQGHLVIQGRRVGSDPAQAKRWTSARLKTSGVKDFQYGRLESCMSLPVGAGLWPAFWMLGTHGEWPAGGEMDIMENVPATGGAGGGLGPTVIQSTIHGPSTVKKGIYSLAASFTLPAGQRIDEAYPRCHIYGIIWSPFMVQMYVDDWKKPFLIRTAHDVPPGGKWIFNAPFYLILNLAVGGDWPGPPDSMTPNPSQMAVDYVRAYKASHSGAPTMLSTPVKMTGAAGAATLRLTASKDSGFVYLACSTESAVATCFVDTGNALNTSVLEFKDTTEQTARILVTASIAPEEDPKSHFVTVTAYTVSGDESTLKIPVITN